jgi:hypothetical protein
MFVIAIFSIKNVVVIPYVLEMEYTYVFDRLCGLVMRVPVYRSRGPGLITGALRLSGK